MLLTFLGTGACFYPKLYNTSAYFEYEHQLFLIDCGETVFEKLLQMVELEKYENIYVIITHLHSDHVGSLGSLISYCNCIINKKVYVMHPDEKICKLLTLVGIEESFYVYLEELKNHVRGLLIKPVEVLHTKGMRCFGYEIQNLDTCIYYSGDASDIPEDILKKFLNKEIQKIYQDTSLQDSASKSHMYVEKLEKMIPIILRKNVICMHLDSECRNVLLAKGFSVIE